MIKSYKIKLIEGEKSVKQEIELEGDNQEEIVAETKRVFELLQPFCLRQTLIKSGVNR